MSFLRAKDYYEFISEANLNQILEVSQGIEGDPDVLGRSETKSITRAKEYLRSRYKTERIFTDFLTFDLATEFTYGDRIDWTADSWVSGVYSEGDRVSYLGRVYEKNATTAGYVAGTLPTDATFFTNLGEEAIYYIAFPQEFDIDALYVENELIYYSHEVYKKNAISAGYVQGVLPTETNYFTRVRTTEYATELTVTGVYPTDTAWTQGDNRNQTIVECIANMTLNKIHSIINPRNIPQLRTKNYTMAIEILKEFQKGEVQADLPDKQETSQEGYSIRMNSNAPSEHGY